MGLLKSLILSKGRFVLPYNLLMHYSKLVVNQSTMSNYLPLMERNMVVKVYKSINFCFITFE